MWSVTFCALLSVWSSCLTKTWAFVEEIRMPNVTTDHDDAYFCFGQTLRHPEQYLTHLKPIYTEVTHHMLLFTCERPGSDEPVWQCEMGAPTCLGRQKIIYSWAMKAKEFRIPPDTSFPMIRDELPYLVLQVHYKDATGFQDLPNKMDDSGWRLTFQRTPTAKLAGIYAFEADGVVKPRATTVLGVSCVYRGEVDLHPFAFRVHAHAHGVLNDAYVEHDGEKYLIGAKSPQEEQTYYPVKNKTLVIKPYDLLVARCKMVNKENRTIQMGFTRKDEMCNFYMMYTVPAEEIESIFDAQTAGCPVLWDGDSQGYDTDEFEEISTNYDGEPDLED